MAQLELFAELVQDGMVGAALNLEPDRHQLAAVFDHLLHDAPIVDVVVVHRLIHIDVRIAGDPQDRLGCDDIAFKYLVAIFEHQIFNQNEFVLGKREEHHPVEAGRNRDHCQLDKFPFGLELGADVNFLVAQKRERMMLVDDLRREHGHQLMGKIPFKILGLFPVERFGVELLDPVFLCEIPHQQLVDLVFLGG